MGSRRHDSDNGVAQMCKAGGSTMLIIPRGVGERAGAKVGDRFRIWTPFPRLILAEIMEGTEERDVWPKVLGGVAAEIEAVKMEIRSAGEGVVSVYDGTCVMCGKNGLAVVYCRLPMCLKCEGVLAAVRTVCYKELLGGRKKEVV